MVGTFDTHMRQYAAGSKTVRYYITKKTDGELEVATNVTTTGVQHYKDVRIYDTVRNKFLLVMLARVIKIHQMGGLNDLFVSSMIDTIMYNLLIKCDINYDDLEFTIRFNIYTNGSHLNRSQFNSQRMR